MYQCAWALSGSCPSHLIIDLHLPPATEALNLIGVALHADRKDVDKVTKELTLHP